MSAEQMMNDTIFGMAGQLAFWAKNAQNAFRF
jgi:hypothetical protein